MRNTFLSAMIALAAGGCASTQLNHNALDLAGTVDDLITRQITQNIGKFMLNPSAIPTQVSIASGSVTTTGQISASMNSPLNKSLTLTNQAVASASPSITNINTGVLAAATITPTAQDQWSQNWGLSPITDSDQMRRLSALYRYVTHPDRYSVARLCTEYPLVATQGSTTGSSGRSSQDEAAWKVTADIDRTYAYESYESQFSNHVQAAALRVKQIRVIGEGVIPTDPDEGEWRNALILDKSSEYRVYLDQQLKDPNKGDQSPNGAHVVEALSQIRGAIAREAGGAGDSAASNAPPQAVSSKSTVSGNITVTAADALFLSEPSCIICSKEVNRQNIAVNPRLRRLYCPVASAAQHANRDLYVNPKLRNDWFSATDDAGHALGVTPSVQPPEAFGHYGAYTLYTGDPEAYHQFVLFVVEATAQGSTSGQSGKSGGGSNKPQGPQAGPQILLQ
jgi:hypothetical protein